MNIIFFSFQLKDRPLSEACATCLLLVLTLYKYIKFWLLSGKDGVSGNVPGGDGGIRRRPNAATADTRKNSNFSTQSRTQKQQSTQIIKRKKKPKQKWGKKEKYQKYFSKHASATRHRHHHPHHPWLAQGFKMKLNLMCPGAWVCLVPYTFFRPFSSCAQSGLRSPDSVFEAPRATLESH